MILTSLTRFRDFGLLLLRIGIGAVYFYNARHLMFDGVAKWNELGRAMHCMHVTFFPVFWGFMAAFSQFFGSMLVILGLLFRPACILLAITMTVAAASHFCGHESFFKASWAIDMAVLFYSLILIGPGKYSVDKN